MPTFIKAGFWEQVCKSCNGYKGWLNLDEFVKKAAAPSNDPFFIPNDIVFYGTRCANVDITEDSGVFCKKISAPNLKSTFDINIVNSGLLEEISFPSLETVGNLNIPNNKFFIQGNGYYLTQINFDSLKEILTTTFGIYNCSVLENLSFPNLTTITNCPNFNFNGNALNQTSVDGILAKLVSLGYSGGTVNLSGGTNSAPSAAGLLDVATLISNGCTVTTN